MGGQAILFAKTAGEIFKSIVIFGHTDELHNVATYSVPFLLAITLVLQLAWVNKGLEYFDALYVIPVFQCFWITSSVVGGIVYFDEFKVRPAPPPPPPPSTPRTAFAHSPNCVFRCCCCRCCCCLQGLSPLQISIFCLGLLLTLAGVLALSQRHSHDEPSMENTACCVRIQRCVPLDKHIHTERSFFCNLPWGLGMVFIAAGSIMDLVALTLAAQSLIAPLGAFTVMTNVIMCYFLLGEDFSVADVLALLLISAGAALCVIFASHAEPRYSVHELVQLLLRLQFLIYLFLVVLLMLVLYLIIQRIEAAHNEDLRRARGKHAQARGQGDDSDHSINGDKQPTARRRRASADAATDRIVDGILINDEQDQRASDRSGDSTHEKRPLLWRSEAPDSLGGEGDDGLDASAAPAPARRDSWDASAAGHDSDNDASGVHSAHVV